MQYEDYENLIKDRPWVKYQEYDEELNMHWKPNTPQNVKEKYEQWVDNHLKLV